MAGLIEGQVHAQQEDEATHDSAMIV